MNFLDTTPDIDGLDNVLPIVLAIIAFVVSAWIIGSILEKKDKDPSVPYAIAGISMCLLFVGAFVSPMIIMSANQNARVLGTENYFNNISAKYEVDGVAVKKDAEFDSSFEGMQEVMVTIDGEPVLFMVEQDLETSEPTLRNMPSQAGQPKADAFISVEDLKLRN